MAEAKAAPAAAANAMDYASIVKSDSPKAYYRLGEASGPLAADSSGNGISGSYPAGVTYANPGAIAGDTNTSIASSTGASLLNAPSTVFPKNGASRTLEAWVNTRASFTIGYNNILLSYNAGDTATCRNPGDLAVVVAGQATIAEKQYCAGRLDGGWHQVAYTYDATAQTIVLYIDGIAEQRTTGVTLTDGAAQSLSVNVNGAADEVAVYPTALTPQRMNAHATRGLSSGDGCASTATSAYGSLITADKPAAYYRLDEASSARIGYDFSGNCQNGARGIGLTSSAPGVPGDTDAALSSTGGVAFAAPSSALPAAGSSRTVEAWISTTTDFSVAYNGISLYYAFGDTATCRNPGGLSVLLAGQAVANQAYCAGRLNGGWHHIAYTYDAAAHIILLYVDGVAENKTTGVTLTDGDLSPLTVSALGSVDDVAIYPTALSPQQINAHATRGLAGTACAAKASTGYGATVIADAPVEYYRLGEADGARIALDYSGNCQNASLRPGQTASRAGGLIGDTDKALAASGDAALTAPSNALPTGAASRTVEAWVNTSSLFRIGYNGLRLEYGYGDTATCRNPGELTLYLGDAAQVQQSYCVGRLDGGWHQIAYTWDSTTSVVRLYIDGVAETIANVPGLRDSAFANLNVYANGGVDEVAVYAKALTPARMNAHFSRGLGGTTCKSPTATTYSTAVRADSPSVFYRFGPNDTARVAFDSSGNCRNASRSAPTTTQPGSASGENDGSLGFPGSGTVPSFDATAIDLPTGGASRTMEAFVRTTGSFSISADGLRLAYDDGDQWTCRNNGSLYAMDDVTSAVLGGAPYCYGRLHDGWHQVAMTYDAASKTLATYIDGVSESVTSNVTLPAGNLLPLRSNEVGSLDEVAVYPTALSAARIAAHWQASGQGAPVGGPVGARELATANDCICAKPQASAGDPVNTAYGTLIESADDVAVPGRGPALDFSRTYSSAVAADDGPLGYGWKGSYGSKLSFSASDRVVFAQENGAEVTFMLQGTAWNAPPRDQATLTSNGDGTWTVVRQSVDTFTFDATGRLTSIADRNRERTTLTYSGSSLATVTDPAGRKLTFTWTGTHITRVSDPAGHKVDYDYSAAGDLTSVTALEGGVTAYTYDSNHLLVTVLDPAQQAATTKHPVTNTYDPQNRVIKQVDPLNGITTFDYTGDPATKDGSTTIVTDPAGHKTQETYSSGVLVGRVEGYGAPEAVTSSYSHDLNTLGVTSTSISAPGDPNDHRSSAVYNSRGLPVTQVDALGRQTDTTYNVFDEPLTTTSPSPASVGPVRITTTFTYDATGNLLTSTRPLYTSATASTTITTTYAHATTAHPGDVTSVTDPTGAKTIFTYDSAGNRLSATTPTGRKSTWTYDTVGRTLTSVNPKLNTTTYTYDAAGRLLTTSTANGPTPVVSKQTFDADGRLKTVTDPQNRTTTYTYDLLGRLTGIKRPDGTSVTSTWFPDGALASQSDAATHTTAYTEDALARPVKITDPLGRTVTYTYNGLDQPLTIMDAKGLTTTNAYDTAGQLTTTKYSDGTPTVTRAYNGAGLQTMMNDGAGPTADSFDTLGRLTQRVTSSGTVAYGYDTRGLLSSLTYPGAKKVARTLNGDGDILAVQDWLGGTTTFGYDANDALTTTTTPNGVVATRSYDPAGRLTQQTFAKGTTNLGSLTYTRNAAAELTQETALGATRSFAYDTQGRLATAGSETFVYNSADNLSTYAGATQTYDAGDHLTKSVTGSATTNLTYDPRGDRITSTGATAATYSYDQENRLKGYTSGATTAAYTYDGDGLRRSKSVNGATTQFVYDVSGTRARILSDTTNSYVYGPDDAPIEQITGSTPTYLHDDQLGSVRLLTNAAGTTAGTASYTAFGKATATGTTSPFGYAGQYTDAESGLQWLRARYYEPRTGTFLTQDPLSAATRAPYLYAGGDPANSTDPDGLTTLAKYVTKTYVSKAVSEFGGTPGKVAAKGKTYYGWANHAISCATGGNSGGPDCAANVAGDIEGFLGSKAVGYGPAPGAVYNVLYNHPLKYVNKVFTCTGNVLNSAGNGPLNTAGCAGLTDGGSIRNDFGHYACDEFGNTYYVRTGYAQGGIWYPAKQ